LLILLIVFARPLAQLASSAIKNVCGIPRTCDHIMLYSYPVCFFLSCREKLLAVDKTIGANEEDLLV